MFITLAAPTTTIVIIIIIIIIKRQFVRRRNMSVDITRAPYKVATSFMTAKLRLGYE